MCQQVPPIEVTISIAIAIASVAIAVKVAIEIATVAIAVQVAIKAALVEVAVQVTYSTIRYQDTLLLAKMYPKLQVWHDNCDNSSVTHYAVVLHSSVTDSR